MKNTLPYLSRHVCACDGLAGAGSGALSAARSAPRVRQRCRGSAAPPVPITDGRSQICPCSQG